MEEKKFLKPANEGSHFNISFAIILSQLKVIIFGMSNIHYPEIFISKTPHPVQALWSNMSPRELSREQIATKRHLNKVEKFMTVTQKHSRYNRKSYVFPI